MESHLEWVSNIIVTIQYSVVSKTTKHIIHWIQDLLKNNRCVASDNTTTKQREKVTLTI